MKKLIIFCKKVQFLCGLFNTLTVKEKKNRAGKTSHLISLRDADDFEFVTYELREGFINIITPLGAVSENFRAKQLTESFELLKQGLQ